MPRSSQTLSSPRPARFASFSGIDGAGKSTQIANLVENLQRAGLRVDIITFWDDVARLKGMREGAGQKIFKGDPGVGSPEAPINRQDKNVQTPWMTCVRMGLYLVDAMSLARTARKARSSGADVVIFDRFLYDELANLNLRNPLLRLYIRALMLFTPRPEVSFILDADPEQARARKPEYPLDFLHINRNAYLNLARLIGRMTVISPMPLELAKAEVIAKAALLFMR